MGFLPTIKCSNCGHNVEISVMGDHVCSPVESIPSHSHYSSFFQLHVPTPASSVGSHMPSPLSARSAPRSPMRAPSEDDSVFAFPMPGNRPPAHVGTPRMMSDSTTRSAPTPSPRLGVNLMPEEIQLPPSPLPPSREPEMSHQRGDSLASHSSYRTSLASTRYGSSTARSSTNSFSRGFRTFMDDTPPMPPPLRTPNKASFSRDSDLSVSSSSRTDRDEIYSGFDFGIHDHRTSGLQDLPEEHSPEETASNFDKAFAPLTQTHLHPADAELGSDGPRRNSDATSESNLSVTSFAQALGLESHSQQPEGSTCSDSSPPSDTRSGSGSSMSSLPSDVSLNRHKPADPLNLSPLVEELPPRTRQTILEMPGRIPGTMDGIPTIPAAFFSPDSPTDPAIGQGTLSLLVEKRQEHQKHEEAPVKRKEAPMEQQPREFHSPRALERSATEPIPPPSRSATRSKGKCKGCNEEIVGKSISSSDGRLTGRYHRGCFVCFECHSPFQTADFYVLNNRPYCAQHYHERNGSLCSICHNGIEGHYLETVERNPTRPDRRRFHPECLQCQTCHVLLNGDYFEWNGEVYCERDARRAAATLHPPPPGRRRPTLGSSPLGSSPLSRGYPPPSGYPPPRSPGPGPGPAQGLRPGPRFSSGGGRRFPERRTTKLMMI
ncbi:uncharacterized protein N7443_001843 [Penicillium atrosanguineum]|uniref:uncharacterized protein n=1 Tax=Penicillium atrosanguineum TaxID=1132637 RepID=UPI00239BA2A1|nr:uncharacterized protein N7443_001843 [Penicillium atrosanguineum]KAJ5121738.1 hypothetical protein N7526_008675 [Penicillium atrosanguineum]KAJ5309382.1 hypothetical protein N7443_001843 [Penicillium atrosanguineum]